MDKNSGIRVKETRIGKTAVNTSVKHLNFGQMLPLQPIIPSLLKNDIIFYLFRGANKKVPPQRLL